MRSALGNVAEISDLKTSPDPSGGTCSFKVPKDFDYKTKLDEIADGNSHVEGWKEAS